ncbi:helix-turn-helix domain-containing protein [Nocardia sp. NPDC003345]
MDSLELLAHPVRLRIVHAMSGGRTRTTAQLCARLHDVSKATVYRHVDILAGAGVLELAGEQRVRGAMERSYRLRGERAVIDPEEVASATVADHRAVFAAAMAVLLAEFDTYLAGETADPAADLVGYRQHTLWLTPAEAEELIEELRAAIIPRLRNPETPERSQYLLSPILFPAGQDEDESEDDRRTG